jgi:hypothetical protein
VSQVELSSKAKWSTFSKIAAALGIVVFLGCLIFFIWISVLFKGYEPFTATGYQPALTNIPEIQAIEGNAEIKIPPSARDIYSYMTGVQEIFVMVRFTINADELPMFLESTLCDEPLQKVSPSSQPSHTFDQDWWEPNLAVELESCDGGRELSETTHFGQEILVDTTNSEYYIIYVTASMY